MRGAGPTTYLRSSLASVLAAATLVACDPCERARIVVDGVTLLDVCVDRATTADARRRGLAGRDLDADEGLLLVFPAEDELCLTNAPVPYAIDALWLDDALTVQAKARLVAADPGPVCHGPARYVLELRAGLADPIDLAQQVELSP
ncbi:MAG: DUF192 domain-containing protein [Deltaproteobacteria bacterium]|jgi:uncharacterized membrane protein (UPF0127 family)|nr:DUF192 domain-containing protein [Deltaproteobacteria bacterium]